jgi:hypothetical protein
MTGSVPCRDPFPCSGVNLVASSPDPVTFGGRFPRLLPRVYGPAGVGKTIVGRRLAASVRNLACVHGDDLKQFVVARDPDAVQTGLSYVGGAALADVFLGAGYDLVVSEFIFPRARHVERFLRSLRSEVPVHLLTLWAPFGDGRGPRGRPPGS